MPALWIAAILLSQAADPRRWEDEIVYVVIIEKFSDGDPSNNRMRDRFFADRAKLEGGFRGGDLRGVLARLPDLADLGVTAILLYPVMQNDEGPAGRFLPTGYRPKNYEHVDINFGDLADLRAVVDAAHARSIRVILDMPITLPGFDHPTLADPSKKDWFGPPTEYGVPRWKVENPEVAEYLIGVSRRWRERSACDGFRIDSAHLQPVAFWKRFNAEIKAGPPPPIGPFVVLPELTIPPAAIGRTVAEAGFDGAYDFSALRVREVFGQGRDGVGMLAFANAEAERSYPSPRSMLAPIDNYEDAFASIAADPAAPRTALALAYILTLDRVPLLYAGDELGVAFREVGGAFPAGRAASPFLARVKALIALRRREPALRRGDFAEVLADDPVYAFLRTLGPDRFLVALNASARPERFARPIGDRTWKATRLDDPIAGTLAKPEGSDDPIDLGPFEVRILRAR